MTVRRGARLVGIVLVLVGILGFVPGVVKDGRLLGLFKANAVHNAIHLLFGGWGLVAARSSSGARAYGQLGGILYIALAVLGWISPNFLDLVPLGGADVWLHALLGIVLCYLGFRAKETA
jgi:hypothetical protein